MSNKASQSNYAVYDQKDDKSVPLPQPSGSHVGLCEDKLILFNQPHSISLSNLHFHPCLSLVSPSQELEI